MNTLLFSGGKTPVFFILSIIAAVFAMFSNALFLIVGVVALTLAFKKPWNIVTIITFVSCHFISSFFFIASDATEYSNIISVKTGGGRVYLDTNIKVSPGDLLVSSFYKDKEKSKPFFKPVYRPKSEVKIYQIPIISSILKLRAERSEKILFASGGKVTVAQALIFGDKRFIKQETRDEYTISGLAHLLAMSGMHVGIIIAIMFTVLSFLPMKLRMIPAILGVFALVIFGAFSVTVLRAAIFSSIWMICYFADIKIDKKPFLLFIAGLFLLFSPACAGDISFLLSFGAVAGIIYLLDSGCSPLKAAFLTGVAATLFTAPLSMYVFGTTNHLSILSTVIMSPIVYLHILFAIIAAAFPTIGIAPLIVIENFSNFALHWIFKFTYFGLILKTIPLTALILCLLFIIVTGLSKYKWVSALSLLIIFYPSPTPPDMVFPKLYGPHKGFMVFSGGRSEIFYQGGMAGFTYGMLPEAAKFGIKNFDYGSIRIFGGKNLYISIKESGSEFTNLCLNDKNRDCSIVYHTKSNSIRKKDLDNKTIHIIYKSKLKDRTIIPLWEKGSAIYDKGRIQLPNENNSKLENSGSK